MSGPTSIYPSKRGQQRNWLIFGNFIGVLLECSETQLPCILEALSTHSTARTKQTRSTVATLNYNFFVSLQAHWWEFVTFTVNWKLVEKVMTFGLERNAMKWDFRLDLAKIWNRHHLCSFVNGCQYLEECVCVFVLARKIPYSMLYVCNGIILALKRILYIYSNSHFTFVLNPRRHVIMTQHG